MYKVKWIEKSGEHFSSGGFDVVFETKEDAQRIIDTVIGIADMTTVQDTTTIRWPNGDSTSYVITKENEDERRD